MAVVVGEAPVGHVASYITNMVSRGDSQYPSYGIVSFHRGLESCGPHDQL